jgi:hypothetical protein
VFFDIFKNSPKFIGDITGIAAATPIGALASFMLGATIVPASAIHPFCDGADFISDLVSRFHSK